jgi:hypothetical protein
LRSLGPSAAAVPPPDDWETVLAVADADGVTPALAYLEERAPLGAPRAVRDRLSRGFASAVAAHVVLSRALAQALAALDAHGIDVIVLKGAALAETLYPHPALRPFHDLDLLVRPDHISRADACLRALGYARAADEHGWRFDVAWDRATLYEAPGGVRVDLHWGLLNEPRYRWHEEDAAAVWERAARARLAGVDARTLAAEDLLLHLAAHLAIHHAGEGLLWQWDVARLIERGLDWDALAERATRWRVAAAVRFALDGVITRFEVAVPPCGLRRLSAGPVRAGLARALRARATAPRPARLDYLLPLLLADRARDAAWALGGALCPSRAWVRDRYPGARSLPRAYLAHAARALRIAGDSLRSGRAGG